MSDQDRPAGLRFRVGRIPVVVSPVFFLIALLGGYRQSARDAVIWAAVVFVSVLLHELGHAWAMQRFGFTAAITLHALGGSTHWPARAQPTAKQSLAVSVSGPGIGFVVCGLVFAVTRFVPLSPSATVVASQLMWVNGWWGVLNMLPILPWDGGHSLDSLIRVFTSSPVRTKVVGGTSIAFGVAAMVFGVMWASIMLAYLGLMGVVHGLRSWQERPAAAVDVPAPSEPSASLTEVVADASDEELRSAFDTRLAQRDLNALHHLTAEIYAAGRYALAEGMLRDMVAQTSDAKAAFNWACTLCRLNRLDEAEAALERSVEHATDFSPKLLDDEDLNALRDRPRFVALAERVQRPKTDTGVSP